MIHLSDICSDICRAITGVSKITSAVCTEQEHLHEPKEHTPYFTTYSFLYTLQHQINALHTPLHLFITLQHTPSSLQNTHTWGTASHPSGKSNGFGVTALPRQAHAAWKISLMEHAHRFLWQGAGIAPKM
jgi:hypothetical protein